MAQGRKSRSLAASGKEKESIKLMQITTDGYLQYFENYFPYLSEREKATIWQQSQPEFNFFANLAASASDEDKSFPGLLYNHCLATKGILLNNAQSLRNQLLKSSDKAVIVKYKQWQANKEQLAGLLSNQENKLGASEKEVKQMQDETEALEKDLNEQSHVFAQITTKSKRLTYESVLKVLKDKEYAIEIIRSKGFTPETKDSITYVALIIGGEFNRPMLVAFKNGQFLEQKAIRSYRNSMRYNIKDADGYDVFWAPIAKYIPTDATVYLSSDGVYNELNIGGLQQPDGSFVSDHCTIIQLTNTKEVLPQDEVVINAKRTRVNNNVTKANTTKRALIVGNPEYYKNEKIHAEMSERGVDIKPLPGTQKEVEAISKVLLNGRWKVTAVTGSAATEDTIRNSIIPEILHIATHGTFITQDEDQNAGLKAEVQAGEKSMLSVGLVLTNGGELVDEDSIRNLNQRSGILTAYEAMNLNLTHTELVVLSACETGVGHLQNGEGVYGLQRAFLVAGAKNIIFSLFKVDDAITTELMDLFYQDLVKSKPKRIAFANAQKAIRKKYPDHPSYWASFIMLGM
jgi:CHAT domain-containing protein